MNRAATGLTGIRIFERGWLSSNNVLMHGDPGEAREFGAAVAVPAGLWAAVQAWDEDALSFKATGQVHVRFAAQRVRRRGGRARPR